MNDDAPVAAFSCWSLLGFNDRLLQTALALTEATVTALQQIDGVIFAGRSMSVAR